MDMRRWWNKPRFDVLELVLVSVAVAFAVSLVTEHFRIRATYIAIPEGTELWSKYGPSRSSEHIEEWIIRDFFNDRRRGFFVDVGANDYRRDSNTYYLETTLDWSGLAIEPQRQFEADYHRYRPRSRFLPFFISDTSNQEATMYSLKSNSLVTSSDKQFTERFGKDSVAVKAPTITLDDLLEREQVTAIDFLSMDIELAEPKALKGFDVERYRPKLVCIEAHPEVRQQILDYFARHRYVIVGKYLRADSANLYFTPASQQAEGEAH
jgi:FkbM family methyltransferase